MSGLVTGIAVKTILSGAVDKLKAAASWLFLHPAWLVAIACAIFGLIERGEAQHAVKLDARDAAGWAAEKKVHAADLAAIRQKTAQAQADDKAHALAVQAEQDAISKQKVTDYEAQLADLRRRYAGLGVRGNSGPSTGQGGGRTANLPSVPDAPDGFDATGAAGADAAFNCSANALQLDALIAWVREEAAVKRQDASQSPDPAP